jgi:hypothetical protein
VAEATETPKIRRIIVHDGIAMAGIGRRILTKVFTKEGEPPTVRAKNGNRNIRNVRKCCETALGN